jgi:cob(I)alamin adenosyltransferase
MVYVFEGYGKGKTSAALGVTVRMLLLKKRVTWISWFKEESWKMAEMGLAKIFNKNLKMYWMGKGFFGGPDDHDTPDGHKKAAVEALLLATKILNKKTVVGDKVSLLVLDEVIRAVNDRLLTEQDVLNLIKMRGRTHLILTGHDCPKKILEEADLVTEMKKIKHPFDKGVLAVRGLDF